MRSANPALNDKTFSNLGAYGSEETMTVQGVVNRTGIMLLLLMVSAAYVWNQLFSYGPAGIQTWIWGGVIGGLVVAMITIFKQTWAPYTAPLYAVLEGLALGGISGFFEMRFPGIVLQATGLTFLTLFALLAAYSSGLIKATENFKLGVAAATGGIFLVYMANFVLGFFGINIPYIHESGLIGIGFSAVVCVVAALNLVLDFDFIENGQKQGAPKYMEWYAAFGLVVTLVWLYLEILRLLAKLSSRD